MAAPIQKEQTLSLSGQRFKARLLTLQQNPNIGAAVLVALGVLFLLLAFPFYPLPVVPLLAIIAGAIAYRYAPLGTAAGMILALPAVAYQSPIFAWVFLPLLAITFFEMFEFWGIISFLQIVILAPFAPFPFNYLSGFIYLAMALASLYSGSKKSIYISIPAIYFVLLLSTIWMTQNAAYLPINSPEGTYSPAFEYLQRGKPEAGFADMASGAAEGFRSMFSESGQMMPAFGKIFDNTVKLFLEDSALLQLASWAIVLFAIGFVPGRVKHRFRQTIVSFSLLLIPLTHLLVGALNPFSVLYTILSIAIIAALEFNKVDFSREQTLTRQEKARKFGKFGIEDMGSGSETLDDVGGYEDVKAELRDAIITPLQKKELSLTYGLRAPKGVLLFGPPGTGKTMLMRALAKEIDYGFYYVKCSDLLSEWYGESEKNISELFSIAKKNAPAILFFDEVDSIGKKRDSYSTDDVAPRIMSLLLQEMDGFGNQKDVIVIGATNVPNQLDSALLRPGRFDKIIYMHLPDKAAREAIFKVHLKKVPRVEDIDYARLAQISERYSGADIKNICTEAIRSAAREAVSKDVVIPVSQKHLTDILSRVRPSVSLESLEDQEQFRLDFERRTGKPEEKKQETEKEVKWSDVVGLEKVKQTLLEAIEMPLLHEDLIKQFKIKPSKGLLLFGPPGCGKTMIVKAAANELKSAFLVLSGADLNKKGYSNAVRVVKETFNRAREQSPAIIFIDEIEAIAPEREIYGGNIVAQILTEMDGMRELKGVMLIGATNRPSMIDSAMMRPGRFDKILYIPPPDLPARAQIFSLNLGDSGKDVSIDELAKTAAGFSGADITSICQEAKMQIVRERIRSPNSVRKLSTTELLNIIRSRRPSITRTQLAEFERFVQEYGERK
jgi:SpoVK/Ycf46/Vps4 family AAA+-type ATPase